MWSSTCGRNKKSQVSALTFKHTRASSVWTVCMYILLYVQYKTKCLIDPASRTLTPKLLQRISYSGQIALVGWLEQEASSNECHPSRALIALAWAEVRLCCQCVHVCVGARVRANVCSCVKYVVRRKYFQKGSLPAFAPPHFLLGLNVKVGKGPCQSS